MIPLQKIHTSAVQKERETVQPTNDGRLLLHPRHLPRTLFDCRVQLWCPRVQIQSSHACSSSKYWPAVSSCILWRCKKEKNKPSAEISGATLKAAEQAQSQWDSFRPADICATACLQYGAAEKRVSKSMTLSGHDFAVMNSDVFRKDKVGSPSTCAVSDTRELAQHGSRENHCEMKRRRYPTHCLINRI